MDKNYYYFFSFVCCNIVFVLLSNKNSTVFAELVAAVILPHGDSSYDPTIYDEGTAERTAANAIHLGATKTGQWLSEMIDPELVFLSTPHGISLSNDFALYLGSKASGSVEIGPGDHADNHPSYTVDLPAIELSPERTKYIIDMLVLNHENVSGVIVPSDGSTDMPLHWAEVIPLLMIHPPDLRTSPCLSVRRKLTESSAIVRIPRRNRKHIIWSFPLRRYNSSVAMIPELLRLGKSLSHLFDKIDQSVAVVVSGDLSHTHEASGPYGYSNASAIFDAAVGMWAENPCSNADQLLSVAAQLQPDALSCAFTGLVLLHGMLCHDDDDNEMRQWKSHVSVNRNATYFGMMVANYTPII